jgi:hypothetical protein
MSPRLSEKVSSARNPRTTAAAARALIIIDSPVFRIACAVD